MPNVKILTNIRDTPLDSDDLPNPQTVAPEDIGTLELVARLPGGMDSGKASVYLRIEMPDGTKHLAHTSAELLISIGGVMKGAQAFEDANQKTSEDEA